MRTLKAISLIILVLAYCNLNAQVAINTDGVGPDSSAMLDVKSTTKGFLMPRVTATERDAINSPATGLMVYVTTDNFLYYYNGNIWRQIEALPVQHTETYTGGDIPTGDLAWPGGCTASVLVFNISPGATVTGVDVAYDMTAANDGFIEDQQSQIYCQETANDEGGYITGFGDYTGTQSYTRTGLSLANGVVSSTGVLTFEMRAWRSWQGTPGCVTTDNKVDDDTWSITVHYF